MPTSKTEENPVRRVSVLILIVCGLLVWGNQTLNDLRAADAAVQKAHQERLTLMTHMRALERSLEDLDARFEAPITNTNAAAQTRLLTALQDQRTALWSQLDPLKAMIGRDPMRLEGVESQFEELSKLVGQLIKTLGEEGTQGAERLRRGTWNDRFQSIRSSVRKLGDQLHREVETEWQATQLMQSEKLKRLIFGMGAITALALLLIGVMLGRAGLKEGQTGEELTRLAGQLDVELHGDDVKERLERLNRSIKSAPIGARFLNKLLSSFNQPAALVVDGAVYAATPELARHLGDRLRGQNLLTSLEGLGLNLEVAADVFNQAAGEWVELPSADDSSSPWSLRVVTLATSSQRWVTLRSDDDPSAQGSDHYSFSSERLLTAQLTANGEVLDANPAACDYLGVSLDDLKMAHKTDLNFGVDPEIIQTIVGQLERSGQWHGVVPLRRAEKLGAICAQVKQAKASGGGGRLYVAALALDELADAHAAISALRDELTQSEEAMTESQERLAHERARLTEEATGAMQSFSRLGDLINAFGSEVRDPLNGAIGITELIADAIPPARADQLRSVSDQLANLVYSLLDQANLESDNLPLAQDNIDLDYIVQHVTYRYSRHLKGSDVELELIQADEPLQPGFGDSDRVTQIVDALIARSTVYAAPGATLRVQLMAAEQGRPMVRIHDGGGTVPNEAREEIFSLTSYSGAAGARRWSGMEPAALRGLAEAMGADLSVEILDDEICWSLTLALGEASQEASERALADEVPAAAVAPAPNEATSRSGRPIRVLVADDDEVNRLVATGLFERAGCQATVVADGQEALDQLQGYLEQSEPAPFDLVVLDLMMPRLGGLETAQAIRSAERRAGPVEDAGLPIVAITAKASDADRQLCLDLGMNGFVSKPYRYEELQNLIAELGL